MQFLRKEKQTMQPLGTKKVTQLLITKKNHATSQDKKNHATSWGKNVLKTQILATIKIQEIGTDHLGLVFCRDCLLK